MKRIPSVSWKVEVLWVKAQVTARLLEGDPRVADLAPVLTGGAEGLAKAADEAKVARAKEREACVLMKVAEEALAQEVKRAELAAWVASNEDRDAPAYQQAFPHGRTGLLVGKRAARLAHIQASADAMGRIAGLEEHGKAIGEALKAVQATLDQWYVAKGRARQAAKDRKDARVALVQDYRVVRATILGRLRVTREVNAFFPDLAPGAGNGKAEAAGVEEAPPVPVKAPTPVAA